MPASTPSAVSMLTDFFASDDIEATARRTGFVQRASTITGQIFLALVTFGVWSDATTTLAPWAAQVPQWGEPREVSPEALHQRMQKRALGFLQEMIRKALPQVPTLDHVCDAGLLTSFPKVYGVDSPGCGLPERRQDLLPGAGGRAPQAGAKMQTVWDSKSRKCDQFAWTAWNIPAKKEVDTVVALAQKGIWFLWA